MLQFLLKRLIGLLFVLIGVTFITFIMGYFAPGDPIIQLLGQHFNQAEYLQLKHAYGLDLPWYQQYYNFLKNAVQFNFGYSYQYKNREVWDILSAGVPVSIELGFWALLIQLFIGVPVGVVSALRANTLLDTTNMTIALVIYAVPVFVLGVIVQVLLVQLDQHIGLSWPVANWGTPWHYTWTDIQYKLFPILIYGAAGFAYFARLSRTSMLEVMRQDFVRTARAKGLIERVVIVRHAFRNSLIPIITYLGYSISLLVAGSFFIERIFNIPGIADITLSSVTNHDYPVIQATTILLATAVVLGNLIADVLYAVVDPRIKLQ